MVHLSLYAFVPLGVLVVTTAIGTTIALCTTVASRGAPRPVRQARSAQILTFPPPGPRPRRVGPVARQAPQLVVYLRAPTAG